MADLGARIQARKQELLAQFKAEGVPPPEMRTFTGAAAAR
jgi:hypothetical protein